MGEFGWELVWWHAWLRKIKKEIYPNSYFIVSSFPGREPLYEFADEFISLPKFYLDNNFSERDYFVDWELFDLKKQKEIFSQMKDLINYFDKRFKDQEVLRINNYPQKINTRKMYYRFQNKINIFFEKMNKKKSINFYNYISSFNNNPGKKIQDPLLLNPVDREIKDLYNPQKPNISDQSWVNLKPTAKGIDKRNQILYSYDITNKPIFILFPRRRVIRRNDKNWTEENWRSFIKLLIEKYNALIIVTGTPEGAFFSSEKNTPNLINIINEKKDDILNLQLAFLDIAKMAIHGRSGSCNLSLQHGCPTFMAGPEKDREVICKTENPLNSKIFYYTEYGVNPKPEKLFEVFESYYDKICKNKSI